MKVIGNTKTGAKQELRAQENTTRILRPNNLYCSHMLRKEEGETWGWPVVLVCHWTKQTNVATAAVRANRTGQQLGRPELCLLLRPELA